MELREELLFKRQRSAVFHLAQTVVYSVEKLSDALAADGGNGVDRNALWLKFRFQLLHGIIVLLVDHIDLVCRNDLGSFGKRLVVGRELFVDGVDIRYGIASLRGSRVHDMHDQSGPLNMAQKLVPKPYALRRALDQSGDIGDHKALGVLQIHHAQIGI